MHRQVSPNQKNAVSRSVTEVTVSLHHYNSIVFRRSDGTKVDRGIPRRPVCVGRETLNTLNETFNTLRCAQTRIQGRVDRRFVQRDSVEKPRESRSFQADIDRLSGIPNTSKAP